MNNINVDIRLRPIRFAFLVRPDDKEKLLKIFQINTCLWGGKYNPIIPFFTRRPNWWQRDGRGNENAKQIINGYLDFFEPDFIVEAENNLADNFGFSSERILKLSDMFNFDSGRRREGYGLSVNELYKELYKKEFQYVRRHKFRTIHVEVTDNQFKSFSACCFGAFPTQRRLNYFKKNYKYVFDPEIIKLDGDALLELYESGGAASPLRMGSDDIEVDNYNRNDPTLFILDANQPRDLLDLWNLRIIDSGIVPIPIQWIDVLSPYCKKFVDENYRPLPGNPHGVMIRPRSLFSRSIPTNDMENIFNTYLSIDREGANMRQDWYPSFWRPTPDYMSGLSRPTIKSSEKSDSFTIDTEKPELRFEPLHPEFSEKYGNDFRWANVIRLSDWSFKNQIASVFPINYRNPSIPKYGFGRDNILSTSEGLVIFPKYKNLMEHWSLMDGTTALNTWFQDNNITATLSDAGRATQQIIQTLDGFSGVRSIAHPEIVKFLNMMARRPITRSAHYREFQQRINNVAQDSNWRGREFETLVEQKVVELGLEIKCNKCSSWNWNSINQLDYSLVCDHCLKEFDFPITNPAGSRTARWSYRVIGPFAFPDFAKGGYSAALAIRFFADALGSFDRSAVTWSSGQELELPDGKKSEADFILWYQRKRFRENDYPTKIIFGEAKSFGREVFKDEDIAKMKLLASSFPGAVLVFATMKEADQLSQDEIDRIKKLANWGREYDKERQQTRAPVILLTGTELFTPYHLEEVWKNKGGLHEKIIEPGWVRIEKLGTLADFTQQLYLGMESYGDWLDKKWGKRRAARN